MWIAVVIAALAHDGEVHDVEQGCPKSIFGAAVSGDDHIFAVDMYGKTLYVTKRDNHNALHSWPVELPDGAGTPIVALGEWAGDKKPILVTGDFQGAGMLSIAWLEPDMERVDLRITTCKIPSYIKLRSFGTTTYILDTIYGLIYKFNKSNIKLVCW